MKRIILLCISFLFFYCQNHITGQEPTIEMLKTRISYPLNYILIQSSVTLQDFELFLKEGKNNIKYENNDYGEIILLASKYDSLKEKIINSTFSFKFSKQGDLNILILTKSKIDNLEISDRNLHDYYFGPIIDKKKAILKKQNLK